MAATCSPSNVGLVESPGADTVIDCSPKDFTRRHEQYDVVFDAVANSTTPACGHVLSPGGAYVTTLPRPGVLIWDAVQSAAKLSGRARRAKVFMARRED